MTRTVSFQTLYENQISLQGGTVMRRHRRLIAIAAVATVLLLLPAPQTAAQSTSGSIRGVVTDPEG